MGISQTNCNKIEHLSEPRVFRERLLVRDALTDKLARVTCGQHPLDAYYAPDTVCAVFDEQTGAFRGLVPVQYISQYPMRIFADLLPRKALVLYPEDAPLEDIEPVLSGDSNTLAVAVADGAGNFVGAVTRASLLEALLQWHQSMEYQLMRDNKHLSRRLDELNQASQALLGLLDDTQDIQTLAREGIGILATLIEARYGAVGLLDEAGEWDNFYYTGISPEQARRIGPLPEGKGLLGVVTRENAKLNIRDMASDPRAAGFPPGHPPMSSLLAAPIVYRETMLGRVYLCDKTGGQAFTADDERIVSSFANTFALVLQQAREQHLRRELEARQALAAKVFEHSQAGIMITDAQANIQAVNPAFTLITGYRIEEIQGKNPSVLSSGEHDTVFFQRMWRDLREQGEWQGEIKNRHKNGEINTEWLKINAVYDDCGAVSHYIATFLDISDRLQSNERIRRLANYDVLTDLPNRALARELIKNAILGARAAGRKMALLFMDLDHFKQINDSFGHAAGDQLLQAVTQRLLSCIRAHKSAIPPDAVARQGGDEFTLLLCDLETADEAGLVAQRLLDTFRDPFSIAGQNLYLSLSIGIALSPVDGDNIDDIIRHADMAMYEAKRAGRNTYKYFCREMAAHCSETLGLKNDLHHALEEGQLLLHYQPRLSITSDRVVGFEALMRWRHPQHGLIPPAKFIPLLEESTLFEKIDDWLLKSACRQCREWQEDAGREDLVIAVNLSARQFQSPRVIHSIRDALEAAGLPPRCLEVELTESIAIQDTENTIRVLNELHEMGIKCSLDDFGTGYSSLSYLRDFRLSALKIDKSFVQRIARSSKDDSVIRAVIGIARSLSLQVVAEGVETPEQKAFLQAQGCQEYQGFLFSAPMPAEQAGRLLTPTA